MSEKARKLLAEEVKQLAELRRNQAQRLREEFKKLLIDLGTGTEKEVEASLSRIDFERFCSAPEKAEKEIQQMFAALYPHVKEGV